MVEKLKSKFFPRDYQQTLFRQMQNLRQRSMTVKAYIEEFYKVSIRAGEAQDTDDKVARYMNGLRMERVQKSKWPKDCHGGAQGPEDASR